MLFLQGELPRIISNTPTCFNICTSTKPSALSFKPKKNYLIINFHMLLKIPNRYCILFFFWWHIFISPPYFHHHLFRFTCCLSFVQETSTNQITFPVSAVTVIFLSFNGLLKPRSISSFTLSKKCFDNVQYNRIFPFHLYNSFSLLLLPPVDLILRVSYPSTYSIYLVFDLSVVSLLIP